jgi:hypothetical protein
MKTKGLVVTISTALILILLTAVPAMAQNNQILQVATHIAEVNYAEGSVDALTDNGYFGCPDADQVLSLYLETAQRNHFPVIIHYVKVMGEGGHWYGDLKKITSKEMGTLVIAQEGNYIDREVPFPTQIQVQPPDPEFVKKPQSITTTIKSAKTEFYEGEWFEMETNNPKYPYFGIYKEEFDPQAFQKLEAVVNRAIKDQSEVTFHFLGAPKTNVTLTKIDFKGHGSVRLK